MNVAIIPAAGSGKRLGGQTPKQFLEIAGLPLLGHTLNRFIECDDINVVVVALPAELVEEYRTRGARIGRRKPILYVSGGAERSDSILNGLNAVAELKPEIVAVHDAVRPFVTPAQISAVIAKAREVGAAILALPAVDTIKEVEHGLIVRTLDRRRIYRAQTPQAFHYELLMRANEEARAAGLPSALTTDDALLAERLGQPVAIVEGSPNNIKITTPEDLAVAEKLFEQMTADNSALRTPHSAFRIGLGNDIHRLVEGRKLILGGVEIPFEKGLLGHSDADALSHAITDAILGAAGLGDIGTHFSDKDPRWKDADSLLFLRHAYDLAKGCGYVIANIDATIIAERPKLLPHIPALRARLCETLGIAETQLNLKAKTNERLDAVGAGEAIAAQAIVLLMSERQTAKIELKQNRMALPASNKNGDLPEGVHLASLDEIVTRFGQATLQRQRVTLRLLHIHKLLLATGKLERFILYGSYVTAKVEPNDVDIFLVMASDFELDEYTGETRDLFSHIIAQRRFGASICWVNRQTSFANVEDLIAGWQTKRDLTRRGIVEVQL